MDFSVDFFNGMINNMQAFGWRSASACPCVDPTTGASKPNCPVCKGKGRIWADEVTCFAGMQNMRNDKAFAQFGTWEQGDALFTVGSDSPMYAAAQYDRIRALYATVSFSLVIEPGANDKLTGTIKSISAVFWLDPTGTQIIQGSIPTVNADGSLSWTTGQTAPPADTAYTVTGVKYLEFYVYTHLPSTRNNNQGASLPVKFLARRFDLYGGR